LRRNRPMDLLLLTAVIWAVVVAPAGAYIDGASTAVIFQWLVGGIAAGWFTIKLLWRRAAGLFGGDRSAAADAEGAEPDGPDLTEPSVDSSQR
jgi:hypothetical protein